MLTKLKMSKYAYGHQVWTHVRDRVWSQALTSMPLCWDSIGGQVFAQVYNPIQDIVQDKAQELVEGLRRPF